MPLTYISVQVRLQSVRVSSQSRLVRRLSSSSSLSDHHCHFTRHCSAYTKLSSSFSAPIIALIMRKLWLDV